MLSSIEAAVRNRVDQRATDSTDHDETATDRNDSQRIQAGTALTEAIKYGSVGGLVATVSMTVFRLPTSKSLPPTAQFWAQYVGSGDPEQYPAIALVLHVLYGVASGVVFALLTPGRNEPDEIAETKGALLGTVYGTVLSVFGSRVLLFRLLEQDLATDERLVFHISHVVYGLTLGTWVGSRFAENS